MRLCVSDTEVILQCNDVSADQQQRLSRHSEDPNIPGGIFLFYCVTRKEQVFFIPGEIFVR